MQHVFQALDEPIEDLGQLGSHSVVYTVLLLFYENYVTATVSFCF